MLTSSTADIEGIAPMGEKEFPKGSFKYSRAYKKNVFLKVGAGLNGLREPVTDADFLKMCHAI